CWRGTLPRRGGSYRGRAPARQPWPNMRSGRADPVSPTPRRCYLRRVRPGGAAHISSPDIARSDPLACASSAADVFRPFMLQIHELTFDAWGRRFFDRATVTLPKDAKVGLVGRNGVGKSTLFKLIKGEFVPGSGEIGLPRGARMGSVDQEHPATPVTLLDTVLAADIERASLLAELETAPPERRGDIYARLAEIGADRAPSRAAEILSGLGFSNADLSRRMAEFSGGWRMRVALAAALFAEPDLLLLD